MKLIMENWRKYLIKESEKGMDPSELASFNQFARFNSIFKEYAADHQLGILRVNNIFVNHPRDKIVELVNQVLLVPPESMEHKGRDANSLARQISEWGYETYPDAKDRDGDRNAAERIVKDILNFHNLGDLRDRKFPQFRGGARSFYHFFAMDAGGDAFPLMFNEPDKGSGFSKIYFNITPPAPGKQVIVSLTSGDEVVPLPEEMAGGSGFAEREANDAALEGKIKITNTSDEFGQPV